MRICRIVYAATERVASPGHLLLLLQTAYNHHLIRTLHLFHSLLQPLLRGTFVILQVSQDVQVSHPGFTLANRMSLWENSPPSKTADCGSAGEYVHFVAHKVQGALKEEIPRRLLYELLGASELHLCLVVTLLKSVLDVAEDVEACRYALFLIKSGRKGRVLIEFRGL